MIGCHHDLKPNNILVQDGSFILADFGLFRLKTPEDDSKTIFKGMGDYLASACRGTESERQPVGRKSDIWALGCILLELLVYMLHGSTGVRHFREERETNTGNWIEYSFHLNGRLKSQVDSWCEGTQRMTDDLAVKLLFKLARQMLNAKPEARPDAALSECRLRARHLIDMSLKSYDVLVNASSSPELFIEYQRLRSWGLALGLLAHQGQWHWYSCSAEFVSQEVIDVLAGMLAELESLQSNLSTFDDKDAFKSQVHQGVKTFIMASPACTSVVRISFALYDGHLIEFIDAIHGNLKPHNILVDKNPKGGYTALIAHLGFATLVPAGQLLRVAAPWPWCAPEYEDGWFTFQEAQKMDIYSFGMVCP